MKKNISIKEIEEIIKKKFQDNGVLDVVGEDKIQEIKNKIKDILDKKTKDLKEQDSEQEILKAPKQAETVSATQTKNPNIEIKSSVDPEKEEVVEKNTELDLREKELIKKEYELSQKEQQLKQKELELSYKPELPQILKNSEPESIIVFSENELSLGLENLSQRKFRLKLDPDTKKSTNELWLEKASTKSNVYLVELKKIGELNFNPYDGTTTYDKGDSIQKISQEEINKENEHNIEQVIKSQNPDQKIVDSINPILDVSQPLFNPDDFQQQEFENNIRGVVEKILKDELSKKNIFSL